MIHKRIEKNIIDIKYENDRILQVSIKISRTETAHIISVYAPDINKPKQEREHFYQELQQLLDKLNTKEDIYILRDFNARIGNDTIGGVKSRFNENVKNENDELLIQ